MSEDELIYEALSECKKIDILGILASREVKMPLKEKALFSANRFHDLEFTKACIIQCLESETSELVLATSRAAVEMMQTRKTSFGAEEIIRLMAKAKLRHPDISDDLQFNIEDVTNFYQRYRGQ